MHNEFHPYYAPYCDNRVVTTDYGKDASDWMVPMEPWGSGIIEIPGNTLDAIKHEPDQAGNVLFLSILGSRRLATFQPRSVKAGLCKLRGCIHQYGVSGWLIRLAIHSKAMLTHTVSNNNGKIRSSTAMNTTGPSSSQ